MRKARSLKEEFREADEKAKAAGSTNGYGSTTHNDLTLTFPGPWARRLFQPPPHDSLANEAHHLSTQKLEAALQTA